MTTVVSVEHLRKTYRDVVAVEDVSFEVERGEIFGLLGPNGAGKTTTVECLQALRSFDSGTVRILDHEPGDAHLRGRLGSQLQESALPERIKVWEALDLFGSFSGHRRDWRALLKDWGLADKAGAHFSSLSGGQRQRLFIALALVSSPEIVFLDEMTAGLDPSARRAAWHLIEQVRDSGVTVVLVTHFMDEAEHLCDRIAIVDKGRISAQGSPQELVSQYAPEIGVSFSYNGSDLSWLERTPDVRSVVRLGDRVEVRGERAVIFRVASALAGQGLMPGDFRVEQPSLDDVFLKITGGQE